MCIVVVLFLLYVVFPWKKRENKTKQQYNKHKTCIKQPRKEPQGRAPLFFVFWFSLCLFCFPVVSLAAGLIQLSVCFLLFCCSLLGFPCIPVTEGFVLLRLE